MCDWPTYQRFSILLQVPAYLVYDETKEYMHELTITFRENQQQDRVWRVNTEKLSGCDGRRNLKFTIASIKTAFMLSMWN